jgi:hypothetical protein
VGCVLSGARRVHPVIVGWFDVAVGVDAGTIPRGPWPHIHVFVP